MVHFDTAIILAGGKSSRMGFDKQFLRIEDQYITDLLVEKLRTIFSEIIIVTNKPEEYTKYPCKTVEDEIKGFGALAGIHTGLKNARSLYNYVIACDMPCINIDYIHYMRKLIEDSPKEVDGVVTRFGEWIEPFNSFYSKRLISPIENNIKYNKRRIGTLLETSKIIYVPENKARAFSPRWEMFMNLNTRSDISQYLVMKDRGIENEGDRKDKCL